MFVNNDWLCEQVRTDFIEAEVLALNILKGEDEWLVRAVYRPPNRNTHIFLEELSYSYVPMDQSNKLF